MKEKQKTEGRKPVLVLSGLDPSGKAGMLRDVRVISELGGWVLAVPTALTIQDFSVNYGFEPLGAELFEKMLLVILRECAPASVKIGMVPTMEIAQVLADALSKLEAPVVYDPVMRSSDGAPLMNDGEESDIFELLAGISTVITPNIPEASFFSGVSRRCGDFEKSAALSLLTKMTAEKKSPRSNATKAVLLKGGHSSGGEVVDILFTSNGGRFEYTRKRRGDIIRGSGCALSSAMAMFLADGAELERSFLLAEEVMDGIIERVR